MDLCCFTAEGLVSELPSLYLEQHQVIDLLLSIPTWMKNTLDNLEALPGILFSDGMPPKLYFCHSEVQRCKFERILRRQSVTVDV